MSFQSAGSVLSIMLAVQDTPAAIAWYMKALGAKVLWSMGSVAGLEIEGAPFFLHEPVEGRFENPKVLGTTTVRIELFTDNPDDIIANAINAGATGSPNGIKDYEVPWGIHRQGGFTDPFGHVWLVGDKSPLEQQ